MDKLKKMEFDIEEKKLHYQQIMEEYKALMGFLLITLFGGFILNIQILSVFSITNIAVIVLIGMITVFTLRRLLQVREQLRGQRMQILQVYKSIKDEKRKKHWIERFLRV